ncbi:MAG: hypothetical protein BM558_07610 [Roseobacter sp. MedPE-SW]|nr:MAG: hypothetical protein BM558_07610 [Roseobacter sp. MedPE-SW]
MNSSLLPLLKFFVLALLGGSAALTAATLVLGLGAPHARANLHAPQFAPAALASLRHAQRIPA